MKAMDADLIKRFQSARERTQWLQTELNDLLQTMNELREELKANRMGLKNKRLRERSEGLRDRGHKPHAA